MPHHQYGVIISGYVKIFKKVCFFGKLSYLCNTYIKEMTNLLNITSTPRPNYYGNGLGVQTLSIVGSAF